MSGVTSLGALAGAWRLVSAQVEWADTGETVDSLGPNPDGWIVFTADGRMVGLMTAAARTDPTAAADFQALFKSMVAYSGLVTVDENEGKFVNRVDVAWQPVWIGTEQVRFFMIEGDFLHIRAPQQTVPNFGDRLLTSIVTWRRA